MPKKSQFAIHSIAWRHFHLNGAGTLVLDENAFWQQLEAAELPDPSVGGVAGQVVVSLDPTCLSSAYTLLDQVDVRDIMAAIHRVAIELFVPRSKYEAVPVKSAKAIVYTRQAIKDDPDWDGVEPEGDYVIVTVLAQVNDREPVSPQRFAENLAGGNNHYLAPEYTLETARAEAAVVAEFAKTYIKLG